MANVFQAAVGLGLIEPLVLNLPAAFGEPIERPRADLVGGKVSEPVGLHDRAVGFVLAVTQHANG